MQPKPDPFLIVWSPQGSNPPKVRYRWENEAMEEAKRLARNTPGADFFVLKVVAHASRTDIVVNTYEDTDFIPF